MNLDFVPESPLPEKGYGKVAHASFVSPQQIKVTVGFMNRVNLTLSLMRSGSEARKGKHSSTGWRRIPLGNVLNTFLLMETWLVNCECTLKLSVNNTHRLSLDRAEWLG